MDTIKTLREVITALSGISVPVSLLEEVSAPLFNGIRQLKILHNDLMKAEQEKHATDQPGKPDGLPE